MAAAAGIFNHAMTAGQALTGKAATPMDSSTGTSGASGTSSSDDTSSSSATISANDFLTLLVTEMQNQDPTADTDPNEYIDQLVQVNSLEQLIDINQTLSTALDGTSTSSSNGASTEAAQATPSVDGMSLSGVSAIIPTATAHRAASQSQAVFGATTNEGAATGSSATGRTQGNLSVPSANAAAQRVAHALDGRTRPSASILSAVQ